MKQTILAALLLASTTSLFAQKETEKIEFRPHWYMQVQGGIGHTIGEGKFSDLVSPAAALSAGYRFTPVWGLRGGFNHKRFFNPYLFAGIGVNMAFNNDDAVALNEAGNKLQYLWDDTKAFVAGRLGVGMDFRICDAVAFNLEGNANTLSDHFNSKKAGNADWQFNILAGVSIRFGKGYTRKTQKAAPTSIPPRNVPKEEPKEDPKPVVVPEKKTEKLQPIQVNVFFKINSAVIRPEEAGKVDELAAYLQKNPAAQVTLTGYADVQTGNHRLNKTLSARRAQAVADALTAKGIAADRITADSQGDTVQPFATPEENRVTICITADAPGM